MSEHTIKIRMSGHGQGTVVVDGVELKCVKRIEFRGEVQCLNQVTLVLLPDSVEIEGPAEVKFEHAKPDFDSEGVAEVSNLESEAREWVKDAVPPADA